MTMIKYSKVKHKTTFKGFLKKIYMDAFDDFVLIIGLFSYKKFPLSKRTITVVV